MGPIVLRRLLLLGLAAGAVAWLERPAAAEEETRRARAEVNAALVCEALDKAQWFFDANRSGRDAADGNVFPWRGPALVHDGEAVGRDLSGGFFDAGDHVKFGLPQSTAAATLALAYQTFGEAFARLPHERTLPTLRHFADYLMKTVESEERIYHQVGDADYDHAWWGPPEKREAQPKRHGGRPRPVWNDTGADVAGATAAHLALMHQILRAREPQLAQRCLAKARQAFAYARAHPRTTTGKGAYGTAYYPSSDWRDDFAFGGAALYLATGERQFLEAAEGCGLPLEVTSPPNWDSTHFYAYLLLYRATRAERYRAALVRAVESHLRAVRDNGLAFYHDHGWGTLRHAMGMAFAVALVHRELGGSERQLHFVEQQVRYLLGDNEFEMSFVIGVGRRWPLHPHHRGAHTDPAQGPGRMVHELTGAMVGGPEYVGGERFVFEDSAANVISNEVAIDYQANCVAALAGYVAIAGLDCKAGR
ncbi:MAG: hypothetical protein KatS3mg102_1895 [Planctomycetota bacterium]|nr:MAG: hypothetical protein KatS3mg102_1895 [Planctomycetota bacterium]